MPALRVTIQQAGRPVPGLHISLPALQQAHVTDEHGSFFADLTSGRHEAVATLDDGTTEKLTIVCADGLSRVRIELPSRDTPITDERVVAAMPADRYVPMKLLGKGAAGTVYRCRDSRLGRMVAIKILNESFIQAGSELDDFLTEARNLAALEHPNLIQIYDVGVHDGRPYMIVQYIDGPDLESLLYSETALGAGAAAAAGIQLMRALDALHQAGFIHRDVKPSNGLVNSRGEVRLADFGLVRPIIDFTDPRSKIFGTPAYMSPEQLQALPLGPATDVYGLGASIYHLASGHLPFEGSNMILAHIVEPPPDIRTWLPEAPETFARLLQAMMDKDPARRPAAHEVIELLLPFATEMVTGEALSYTPRLSTSDVGGKRTTAAVSAAQGTLQSGEQHPALARSRPDATRQTAALLQSGKTSLNDATTDPVPGTTTVEMAPRRAPVVPITLGLLALVGIAITVAVLSSQAPTSEPPPAYTLQTPPPDPVAVAPPVTAPPTEPPVPDLVAEAILAATARGASIGATTREIAVTFAWNATHSDDQVMPADLVQQERARREQTEAAGSPTPNPGQGRVAAPAPTPAPTSDAVPEPGRAQPVSPPSEPAQVQQPAATPVEAPTPTPNPTPAANPTPNPTPAIAPDAQPSQADNPVAVPANSAQDEDDAGNESDRPRRNRAERPPISF